jgi:hypothetical protein
MLMVYFYQQRREIYTGLYNYTETILLCGIPYSKYKCTNPLLGVVAISA